MMSPLCRCYYRCTYLHDQNCQATKQVQQLNSDDPPLFDVTYNRRHTCYNVSSLKQNGECPPQSKDGYSTCIVFGTFDKDDDDDDKVTIVASSSTNSRGLSLSTSLFVERSLYHFTFLALYIYVLIYLSFFFLLLLWYMYRDESSRIAAT
jgi:WRKY DNA -binding domain